MHGIELREALRQRKRVYGFAVEGYGQPRWPRFFSDIGLDYVFIDSEHTPQNRETIAWACQAYAANNIAPLVRIPTVDASQAAMALDAGAHGVIVPYVETVEQVRAVVGAVKYRPLKGQLLEAIVEGRESLDEHMRAYLEDYNRHASLIIMIESPAGIQNLQELLAVGGVDGVLIGPHDLSVSHSVPEQYDSPVFVGAVQRIISICQSQRTSVGIHYVSGDTDRAAQWIAWGFNLICHRSDTLYTAGGAKDELWRLRQHLGDADAGQESGSQMGAAGHAL